MAVEKCFEFFVFAQERIENLLRRQRREAELTVEKQREFARAAIRERKFDQAYQDWVRELRDTATVKILNVDDAASAAPR